MRASVVIGRTKRVFLPALLLDFKNGFYRKDGVINTFAGLGGTFIGSPTVNGSGLTCTGTQRAEIVYGYIGDALYVIDFDGPSSDPQQIFIHTDGDTNPFVNLSRSGTGYIANSTAGVNATQTGTVTSGKVGLGYQNSNMIISINGAALTSTAATNRDFTGCTVTLGGDKFGSSAMGTPIRSFAIYLGSYTAADTRTLTTP